MSTPPERSWASAVTAAPASWLPASAHLLVDVVGYLVPNAGDRLTPVVPRRLVDTARPRPRRTTTARVALPADAPSGTTAATLNVTVTDAQGDGFITVYPADGAGNCAAPSPTSNLNFRRGMTRANLVYGTLGGARSLCVYSSVPTHVIVDLNGYLGPNGEAVFSGQPSQRLLDTRQAAGLLKASQATAVRVALDVVAAQLNVTATSPQGDGFLTAWPSAASRPDTSTVNYRMGETSPNGTTVSAGGEGGVRTRATCRRTSSSTPPGSGCGRRPTMWWSLSGG